jgi:hypothetical protein
MHLNPASLAFSRKNKEFPQNGQGARPIANSRSERAERPAFSLFAAFNISIFALDAASPVGEATKAKRMDS